MTSQFAAAIKQTLATWTIEFEIANHMPDPGFSLTVLVLKFRSQCQGSVVINVTRQTSFSHDSSKYERSHTYHRAS